MEHSGGGGKECRLERVAAPTERRQKELDLQRCEMSNVESRMSFVRGETPELALECLIAEPVSSRVETET
jgi:hypothetical protein